jgi:hypothetical protein
MPSYRDPDIQERQKNAAAARRALLEKHKKTVQDPSLQERLAERKVVADARAVRQAERKAIEDARKAELAAEAARQAELKAQAEREAEEERQRLEAEEAEKMIQLLAEQKAARDARYAARKAAKKERRKG